MQQVNGKQLFVERAGEGPAILFVHGLGGTTNFYQPQARVLAEQYTVVRFDLSGAGRSPFAGPVSVESLADDIDGVLDAEAPAGASIVAHSMGTLVAAHYAATRPDRVERIVLLGPVLAQQPPAKEATRARAATVRERGMAAVADTIVAAATSEQTRTQQPAVAAFVRELLMGQDPQGYAALCETLANATDPELSRVTAPVLLLRGSEDKVSAPSIGEAMVNALPTASYQVIEGIGHWAAIEAAQRVTDALADFLHLQTVHPRH